MGNLMKELNRRRMQLRLIVAGSVVIELVEKYGSRSKKKSAASKVAVDNAVTEN